MEVMNERIRLVESKKQESVGEKAQKERAKNICIEENKRLDECRKNLMALKELHDKVVINDNTKLEEMKSTSENLLLKERENITKIDSIIGAFSSKIQNYTAMLDATKIAYTSYINAFNSLNNFASNPAAQESYNQQMVSLGIALHNYNAAVINNHNAFCAIQDFLKSNTVKNAMEHIAQNEQTIQNCSEFYKYCLEKGREFLSGTANPPMPGVAQPLAQQPQIKVSLPKEQCKIEKNGNHKVTSFCVGSLTHTMTFDLNAKYNEAQRVPILSSILIVNGIKFADKFRYMPSYCLSQDEKVLYIFGGYSKVIIKLTLASNEVQEVAINDMLTKGTGIIDNGRLIIIGAVSYVNGQDKIIENSKTTINIYSANSLTLISSGVIENMKFVMSPGLIRLPEKDKILICGGETPVGDYEKVYKLNLANSTATIEEASLELPASFYSAKPYYFNDNRFCVLIDAMNKAHIYNLSDKSWLMISAGSKNIDQYIKKLIL